MPVVLLCAPSGLGKTTACLRLSSLAQASGCSVAGLLSVPVYEEGRKMAIQLRDLTSGAERPLARLAQQEEQPDIGPWLFDNQTLAWGQRILENLPAADLFVLDEIGPLEVLQGRGLVQGLRAVEQCAARLAVVTVRPSLVEDLSERWQGLTVTVLFLTEENRAAIPDTIIQRLEECP